MNNINSTLVIDIEALDVAEVDLFADSLDERFSGSTCCATCLSTMMCVMGCIGTFCTAIPPMNAAAELECVA